MNDMAQSATNMDIGRKGSASPDLSLEERERIDFLRILLVFLLVCLHFGAIYGSKVPSTVGYAGQEFAVASILVSFVSFLGYTAVPMLSVISGFLFFRGSDGSTPPDFGKLLLRRAKSLALPLLIWSSLFLLVGYAAFVASGTIYNSIFAPADGDLIRSIGNAWLGIWDFPLAIQLWFVRDLLLSVLVSPIVWLLVGRAPLMTLAVMLVLWLSGHTLWIFLKLDVIAFFCVGAAFAMHGWRRHLPERFLPILLVVFPILVLGRAVAPVFVENPETNHVLFMATCLMRIVGVIAIWSAAPLLMTASLKTFALRYSYLAFFIHCAHYPPIFFLKTVAGGVLKPSNDVMHLVVYFGTIAVTLVGVVFGAYVLRSILPGLFSILSGGRTVPVKMSPAQS